MLCSTSELLGVRTRSVNEISCVDKNVIQRHILKKILRECSCEVGEVIVCCKHSWEGNNVTREQANRKFVVGRCLEQTVVPESHCGSRAREITTTASICFQQRADFQGASGSLPSTENRCFSGRQQKFFTPRRSAVLSLALTSFNVTSIPLRQLGVVIGVHVSTTSQDHKNLPGLLH